MKELSIFLDESGSDGLKDRYYLLTLVAHEQSDDITKDISIYEQSLRSKELPNYPFHASPLLNGHGDYEGMELAQRKQILSAFRVFFRHTPIRYCCFALKVKDYDDLDALSAAMRKELIGFLFDHLSYFQDFESIKIYYDNGQNSIANAVHRAVDYALAKGSVTYKLASAEDYRLAQIADYICTMELTSLKYQDKNSTATDEKFFGSWRQFKKGILKELSIKAF